MCLNKIEECCREMRKEVNVSFLRNVKKWTHLWGEIIYKKKKKRENQVMSEKENKVEKYEGNML